MDIRELLADTLAGHRLSPEEATSLYQVKGRDIHHLFMAADELRERKAGNTVTFVRNQNVHITNICKNLCNFCGFGRKKGSEGAYCFGKEEIQYQIRQAQKRKVTEICFLSGVHPDFTIEHYLLFMEWVHEILPDVHIHAFSPDEVAWVAEKDGLETAEVIRRLMDGGLGSMQGTAAEILVDAVRDTICPVKIRTAEWARIITEAHRMGLSSTATLMYGSCETPADRAAHLEVLRSIQDETGGFTEMVHLPFVHQKTPLYEKGMVRFGPTGADDLITTAVSRLYLDNFDHIQISWPKIGVKLSQMALVTGADDLSGTMYVDAVTGDAGASIEFLDPEEMAYITSELGRELRERSTLYRLL